VEREARTIDIRRLELVALRETALDLVCECAKGTYIRVLGEDIARHLGTWGHLTRLRRMWVEPFQGMPMTTLEDALAAAEKGEGLMPPGFGAAGPAQGGPRRRAGGRPAPRQGGPGPVPFPRPMGAGRVRVYGPDGAFLG
jgi:hypothetical protein